MLNVSNHSAKIVLLRAQKKHGKIKLYPNSYKQSAEPSGAILLND
jgi:hypothetical protein